MARIRDSWCFCKGVRKSEKMKASIFSGKSSAMGAYGIGTGFLVQRNLFLTTHAVLPSVASAEGSEILLHNGVAATLVPHRFFITSSIIDLTVVGVDAVDGEDSNARAQQSHYLRTSSKPTLSLGSVVYLLGHIDKKELVVGEGKVVIATDNLIKLSTNGVRWSPGSAGFDTQGHLAFMVCDPMKLSTSKSSSTSPSSSTSHTNKDMSMQFGVPIPVIRDWLNQHCDGSLDELNKPKLPLVRFISSGQKSEHSCSSLSTRRVFRSTGAEKDGGSNDESQSSSIVVMKSGDRPAHSSSTCKSAVETHARGIPTPEIYESPKLTAFPLRNRRSSGIQLLDINFLPRIAKASRAQRPAKGLPPTSYENPLGEGSNERPSTGLEEDEEADSMGSVNGAAQSGVQSSSWVSELHNGYESEGETMYSAETAESRNYTSPPREGQLQQVRRSQSCVGDNRWRTPGRKPEKKRSFMEGKKVYSQGGSSLRNGYYCSPTVSSIMKKRNNMERPGKAQSSTLHSSPRWLF